MSAGLTATPLRVSFARTLTTPVPPDRPLIGPALSFSAFTGVGASVIVTLSVAGGSTPPAGVPDVVAMLVTVPGVPSRSAATTV